MFAQARLTARSMRDLFAVLLLGLCCCLPMLSWAGHPGIVKLEDANTWRSDGSDYLQAQFTIELSTGAEEAVQNGVPLIF